MLRQTGKLSRIALICVITLIAVACNVLGGSESADEETPTVEVGEAQAVREPTSTSTPLPTPTKQPTATRLRTELSEEISPISPISPVVQGAQQILSRLQKSEDAEIIPGSEEPLAAAVEDLSERTGVPPEQISLVSMEPVEWSDSSLGCPQEGFMYAQVITPGYMIIFEADGQQYAYHTDLGKNVVLCES